MQRLTEARFSESVGASPVTTTAYRKAIQAYTRIGYKRRAVMATLRLAQLSGDGARTTALICQGKSTPEIIAKLRGRSEFTIRNHLTKIFERLGTNTREEVAVEAVLRGYWEPRRNDPGWANGATG